MSLATYQKKRHFARTPEPRGAKPAKKPQGIFVVQCHDASHLHYDFRLGLDGVLKSWAVPKGPSLDPNEKRLAIEVEDHPLEYGSFEGTIPQGQYGGGTVMLWDRGQWQPDGDPREGLRGGKLEFHLDGEKLRGGWLLIRSRTADGKKNQWLLIKRRDEESRPGSGAKILQEAPRSVKTGRDLEDIAAGRKKPSRNGAHAKPGAKSARTQKAAPEITARSSRKAEENGHRASSKRKDMPRDSIGDAKMAAIPGAISAELPRIFRPQLAMAVKEAPQGDEWLHETKFDGNRIALRIDGTVIDLLSRRMQSWTARLPHVVEAAKKLAVRSALFDGEAVIMRPDGASNFQDLQTAFRDGRAAEIVYCVFDVLFLDGRDLTGCPLEERKQVLAHLIPHGNKAGGVIRFTEHIVGNGPKVFAKSCKQGLEGIVSKRRDGLYVPGRHDNWLKVKCVNRGEFVIGGYTEPAGARKHFGALLLGYYQGQRLIYAGRVGTGFDVKTLREIGPRLARLEQSLPPFVASAELEAREKGVHWVAPNLVAQVQFRDWTRDGILRQPSFQGLRDDKRPSEVSREMPVDHAGSNGDSASLPSTGARRVVAKRFVARGGGAIGRKLAALKVNFTHPDKVLYQEQGITKIELAEYYARVADWMLPHVAGRPLMLVRCPDGNRGQCFHQKHASNGADHLRLVPIKESGKSEKYVVVDDLAGLLSLVQLGVLEIHTWGSRADDVERPDRIVFDLDPDTAVPWTRVVESARQLKALFDDLGLKTFVKTTGGKGLHIVMPILRKHEWPEIKEFSRFVATAVAHGDPDRYTANLSKAARKGKIFIDYLRNQRGATFVAPYSTRAHSGAPVSAPVTWDELGNGLKPDTFNLANIGERLDALDRDPWEGMAAVRQSITAGIKKKLGY